MTVKKFYCEETEGRCLEVGYFNQNYISICIDDNDDNNNQYDINKCMLINLSIKQAEILMDEIHKSIIKAEGGSHE